MKRIIKQDLSITLAVLAIAIFAFFFWMYPYHLFHKEQMMLFLYSGEFDGFCADFVKDELWTLLSGGVGKSKTWYMDITRLLRSVEDANRLRVLSFLLHLYAYRIVSYETYCIRGLVIFLPE